MKINIIIIVVIVSILFRCGHLNIVQFLVDGNHYNPEVKDNDGETPLHKAAGYV